MVNSAPPVQSSDRPPGLYNLATGYAYNYDTGLGYPYNSRYGEGSYLLDKERKEAVKIEEKEKMMREKNEKLMRQEEEVRRKIEEVRKMERDARRMSEEARKQWAEAGRREKEAKRMEKEANRKEKEARRLEEEVKRKVEEARRKEARQKEEEVRRKAEDTRLSQGGSMHYRDPDDWTSSPYLAPGLSDTDSPDERRRTRMGITKAAEHPIPNERYNQSSAVNEIKEQEEAARKAAEEARKMSEKARNQEEEASRKQEVAMRLEEEAKLKEEEARKLEEVIKRKEAVILSHMGSMSREYRDPDVRTGNSPPSPGLSDAEPPDERKRKIVDGTRASEGPHSPAKYENWRASINAEEAAGPRGGTRRDSTASQHSSNSSRALTTESIFERPDGSERGNVPKKNDGEPIASSPDKGKERQHQSGTLQLATEPNGRREVPVSSPLSESFHETLQLLLVTLTELWAVRGPLVNDKTLVLFRELLNIPDAIIASGVETTHSVELFLDFLLHLLREGSLHVENFTQDAKRKARKLIRLVSKTSVLPRHLFITDVELEPQAVAVGGFGRVFKGKYGGQLVALKMLYQSRRPGDSIEKDLYTEAFTWRSLSHRFILPLLGIYEEGPQLFLVSPFMTNGPLRDWRKEHRPVQIDEIRRLLLEVAEGIQYIHSEGIVHGDLHGANVLLDSEFHCQITDFGSTRHCDVTVTRSTTTLSFNFAAPELIGMCATCGELDCDESHNDEDEQHKIKTMKTDVYAFGCLYYAIFFDTLPFHGKRDFQIIRLVTKGVRPERLENPMMEEHVWNLVQRCWTSIPSERPTMEEIMGILTLAA